MNYHTRLPQPYLRAYMGLKKGRGLVLAFSTEGNFTLADFLVSLENSFEHFDKSF